MANNALPLVNAATITASATVTTEPLLFHPHSVGSIAVQSSLTYGSGGTTLKVYMQTSLDNGANWIDIAVHAFTTASSRKVSSVSRFAARAEAVATDGTLADDTELDGVIGDRIRVKYISTGTYAGSTTLSVHVVTAGG